MNNADEHWGSVVAAVLAGEAGRFAEIVAEFQEELRFAISYHFRGDDERIDEIVHRTFIRAYRGLARFERGRPLGPWLRQIARHEAANELRHAARQASTAREYIDVAIARSRGNADDDRDASADQLCQLRKCLDTLGGESRKLVQMHYFEGRSFEAIGRALGRSAVSLRMAMVKIRRGLRSCMEGKAQP